jgi:hypothetical protein
LDQSKPSVTEAADPRVIEAATAAMVGAIEWDISIAGENLKHSEWLTAFCTAGLALLVTQAEKLSKPSILHSYVAVSALIIVAILFVAGGIIGGIARRRLKRGIELKRQQNTFFLKQKAIAMADLGRVQNPFLLERLWQLALLPEAERVQYLDISKRDVEDQSENKLISLQEILVLVAYLSLIALTILRSCGNVQSV